VGERLTTTKVAPYRRELLEQQEGRCALCHEPVAAGEAVLDHDHTTGQIRGVLHRGCNAMLGHLENNRARHLLKSLPRFAKFLSNTVEYLYRKRPDDTPLYPSHRTTDERRELRNKRARRARASMKGT